MSSDPAPSANTTESPSTQELRDLFQADQALLSKAIAQSPDRIGDYRIIRKIDEGGMGLVYEARHARLDQRVALKLVRPGFMTPQMLRRFEYEATLLARLDHPGIARIFYAGIWDGGAGPQPYFAMEYVEGKPLDEYLKENRPKLKQRQLVELFHAICDAVQHAHGKGIVHRDLKPDNILITTDGTRGERVEPKPKILDFGVARAIDADGQAMTMQTESGAIVGTVPYMAPEQVRGEVEQIEQATDVYALGVIGYEILSDRMPYPVKGRPLPEAARIICEDEPSRLSSINKSLRGDVETIVQKALEKEKTRRYHTAGELASDVKRYLDYEPITARPPSTWYNLRRFAKRNKLLVAGTGALILTLVAGIVGTSLGFIRAERQKRDAQVANEAAQAVNTFLTEDVLSGASPERIPDKTIRDVIVNVMLKPAEQTVGERFGERPVIEASVRHALSLAYSSIGRNELALLQAEQAMKLHRDALGNDHQRTFASLNQVAWLLQALGRLGQAEPLYREAVERSRRLLGDDHETTLGSINNLGYLLEAQGKPDEAEPLFRETLERRRRKLGTDHPETLRSMNNMGMLLRSHKNLAQAEVMLREATQRYRSVEGDDHPATLLSISNLGLVLGERGKFVEAEPLCREALERRRRVLGDDHPDTLVSINNFGWLFAEQRRFEEAEPLYREALERKRRILGDDHPDTLLSFHNLGWLLSEQRKLSDAEPFCREAVERRRRVLGDNHRDTLKSIHRLGWVVAERGRFVEAEALYREGMERRARELGEDHPDTLLLMNNLAFVLARQGKLADAEALHREALQRSRRVSGDYHPETLRTLNNLSWVIAQQGRLVEAELLYAELFSRAQEAPIPPRDAATHISQFGPCLVKLGRHVEAAEPLRLAYEKLKDTGQEKHPQFKVVLECLIEVAEEMNRPDDAARFRAELAALVASTQSASQPATAPANAAATAPAN